MDCISRLKSKIEENGEKIKFWMTIAVLISILVFCGWMMLGRESIEVTIYNYSGDADYPYNCGSMIKFGNEELWINGDWYVALNRTCCCNELYSCMCN